MGIECFDAVAANDVNGTSRKPQLTMLPFIHLFEFGVEMDIGLVII
jgi:hypothetical protein